jgi:hypothetical protein
MALFAEGMDNIVQTHKRVAELYFEDQSIDLACPPIRALLHIMAHGQHEGKELRHPEVRALFTREALLASDWYVRRLEAKQALDLQLWNRHIAYLEQFLARATHAEEARRLGIPQRLKAARLKLKKVQDPEYLQSLKGTLGLQPLTPE